MSQHLISDVYKLWNDLSRFEMEDWEYDLEVSQDCLENVFFKNRIYEIDPLSLPNPIICEAEPGFIQYVDYAHTNFYTNGVMSKRMLEVLQSVKPFDCRVYPIQAEDFVTLPARHLVPNNDFVAVQLTTYLDVFDYETSVYTKGTYVPPEYDEVTGAEKWFPTKIQKLVLTKPKEGYPPIFRIDQDTSLYISDEARQALKKARITGIEYVSINGYRHGEISSEIDIQLEMPDWDTREAEWQRKTRK
jgi:hypothetical protein